MVEYLPLGRDLERLRQAHDLKSVADLDRSIQVKQTIENMDDWTDLPPIFSPRITDKDVAGVGFHSRFEISRKNQPRAAELFKRWYLRQAEERIPQRAEYFAEALGVGFNRILISDLKVRWGSCTPKSNLNFNWRLMKAPTTVIDYVIVHELAHLIEPNHTRQFWNIVSIQVPRFNWAKQWLREHGDLLETDF